MGSSPPSNDAQAALQFHRQMEDLLLRVANRFLALRPEDDVDGAVAQTLAEVGELAGVDLVALFGIDEAGEAVVMTHRWGRPGVPLPTEMAGGPLAPVAEWVEHLRRGQPHVADDVASLTSAPEVQESLRAHGVQSVLVVPMLVANRLCGWLSLASIRNRRQWGADALNLAWFIAHSVAQSLRRLEDDRELRRSEARFLAFLEQNPDSMYVLELDPPMPTTLPEEEQIDRIIEARVVLCNDGGATIFGRKQAADVLGERLRDLFVSAFTEEALEGLRQETLPFVRNAYRNRTDEAPNPTANGQVVWVTRSAHGVVEDGHLTTIWATVRDITEEKRTRDERAQLARRLQQSERLESVGLLAGGVAHDFNNLLLAILANADLAAVEPANVTRVQECLAEVRRAGQRAAELTRQLLAFSQRQPTIKKSLGLNSLLRAMTRMLQRLLPESIELDFIPGHELGTILADEAQMEQVVLNLCVNARDAMAQGGRLTLETQNVRINGEYCRTHPWARPGRYVLLTVADTGTGIDDAALEHIFDPFFTTKPHGHGTGLGLATVYGIVQQHNGMVQVYSEVGVGTTFKVYLPITELGAGRMGTEVRPAPPGGTETILLAEDEDQVRSVTARILERAGYTVDAVADGAAAVEAFEQDPGRYHLVLLDVVMPVLNGREASERMRRLRSNVPVIFSSGYTGAVLQGVDLQSLGSPVLHKPYDPDHLLATIRSTLDDKGELGK
jgi:PAS domain S-box-containing protein